MSRTDLDPSTLAANLRCMVRYPYDSDGSVEWVYEPIQAAVLLDVADALDENARLREMVLEIWRSCPVSEDECKKCPHHMGESDEDWCDIPISMQELGIEVTDA